jgi:hypothetical protein
MTCEHFNFQVKAEVNRLTREEGGPVIGYGCDVTVHCRDCGLPFRWLGLPSGVSKGQPTTSIDGLEMRGLIAPGADLSWAKAARGVQ